MISGIRSLIAAWYGWRPAPSSSFDASMTTTWLSVFCVARPMPGKCLSDGRTSPASRPAANASATSDTVAGDIANVRPAASMNEPGPDGTSATGAKSTLMPRSRRALAVASPWSRATDGRPSPPISAGVRVGGAHGIRLISPPSWSTPISSVGCPPFAAAACSDAVRSRSAAGVRMLGGNRITPPTSPRSMRPSSAADAVVPLMRTTSFWPISWAAVGVVGGRRRRLGRSSRAAPWRSARPRRSARRWAAAIAPRWVTGSASRARRRGRAGRRRRPPPTTGPVASSPSGPVDEGQRDRLGHALRHGRGGVAHRPPLCAFRAIESADGIERSGGWRWATAFGRCGWS